MCIPLRSVAITCHVFTPKGQNQKKLSGSISKGFRYRKNDPRLPGKPDIVLPKYKTVVFVNGCFWHRHEGCKYFVWPKNNAEFWRKKIMSNVERDNRNYSELKEKGWSVVVIWECELKDRRSETLSSVVESLKLLPITKEKM